MHLDKDDLEAIDSLIANFELGDESKEPRKAITLWLTEAEHAVYSSLQTELHRKPGKLLTKIAAYVIGAVDRKRKSKAA